MLFILFYFISVFGFTLASPAPYALPGFKNDEKRQDTTQPICGQIIDAVNDGYTTFYASVAYECLQSVPFIPAVAQRFLNFLNETLQFQSTLAYLKNPPVGYQQPSIDVIGRLKEIEHNVETGFYHNEYAFEQDVYLLMYAMHDYHVDISAGIFSTFTFGSQLDISSISVDGIQAPQVYFTLDTVASRLENWQPSPIVQINGQDVIEYLTNFAALQSAGTLEPHADWNQLFSSPAGDIQGFESVFRNGATFYPGDTLNFTLANNTVVATNWTASYDITRCTGPLTTAGDFYNFFVLGLLPASYEGSLANCIFNENFNGSSTAYTTSTRLASRTASPASKPSITSWSDLSLEAYPTSPNITQPNLSVDGGGGVLTAYFLHDISTGVLSIPSFALYNDGFESFSPTVDKFITTATANNISRVIIDLQQNLGGDVVLAISTFKQFFPNIDVFGGSRRRTHHLESLLGNITTSWWNELNPFSPDEELSHYFYADDEWVVTNRINADSGETFRSWSEFNGPRIYHDDEFSLTERYNLSDTVFNAAAFGVNYPFGYGPGNISSQNPAWQPKDIVLLTDGLCSSACVLFLEMMTHQAGVRTVVVGGSPIGPSSMQAASGNRGAVQYDAEDLTDDFSLAADIINDTIDALLPFRDDSGIRFDWISFNLRDQIRKNESDPLQFKYIPANCRLYYKLSNFYNMTELWYDVAKANWNNQTLCIPGSTHLSNNTLEPPVPMNVSAVPPLVNWTVNTTDLSLLLSDDGGIWDAPENGNYIKPCIGPCSGMCKEISHSCGKSSKVIKELVCFPACKSTNGVKACSDTKNSPTVRCSQVKSIPRESKPRTPFSPGEKASTQPVERCLPPDDGKVLLGASLLRCN